MNITRIQVALLGLFLGCSPLIAQDGDDEELLALLQLLDEETEIATRTRLNADYVPGVVTVLRGDDLLALGARHVLDGLALVPGIEAMRDDIGNATLRVRGIDFFENSGQVQVLVDGVSYFRETSGQNGSVMLMPIEQVDRIEVIRGPGSEVYGDFAFAGLVNIITRSGGNSAYIQGGDGGLQTGGVALSRGKEGDDFRMDFAFTAYEADDLEAAAGTEVTDEERYFAHLNSYWKGLSLKVSALDRSARQSGANRVRPREDSGLAAELRYKWQPTAAGVAFESWFNYADNDMENNGTLFFDGGRSEIGSSALWRWAQHQLLGQLSYGWRDYDITTLPPPRGMVIFPGSSYSDQNRSVSSASLQDQIDLEPVTLTIGARYDWLEGIDNRVTPRVAAVWRINEQHALKTQYAEGFRSGTASNESVTGEINDQLNYEVIKTAEAQYIYRSSLTSFKTTLYHSEVEDRIQPGDPPMPGAPRPRFRNFGTIDAQGVELEWSRQLGSVWKVLANVSYQDTDVNGSVPPMTDGPSFAQVEWLGNIGLIAKPWSEWTLGLHLNHVGERTVLAGAKRDGYDELNLNVMYEPNWAKGLRFRLLARNATEDDVTYVFFLPPGNVRNLDYDQRRVALEVEWRW